MSTWSLRTRFLLFALACLIPLAAVLAYYVNRTDHEATEEVLTYQTTIANSVSRSLTAFLTTNTDALEGIAALPGVISLNPDDSDEALGQARRVRPEFSSIFLIDTDQQEVSTSGTLPAGFYTAIKPLLDQAETSASVVVSDRMPLDGETSGIVIMVPVTTVQTTETTGSTDSSDTNGQDQDEVGPAEPQPTQPSAGQDSTQPPGEITGIIGGIIQTDRLTQAALPASRGLTEVAVIGGGTVLLSTAGIEAGTNTFAEDYEQTVAAVLDGEPLTFQVTDDSSDRESDTRTAIALPVAFEQAQWVVISTHPEPSALASVATVDSLTVVLLAILVIVALAVVLGELTARPLRNLSLQAKALHQGTLKGPIAPQGGGEIRTLSEQFGEMAEQINFQVAGLEGNRLDRERQAAQMRDLLRRTNRLQEDERRRIAGDIHDAVSPLITGALYQARALQMSNGSTSKYEQDSSLASVSDLLDRASNELHDVIFALRPPDLDDLGVVAAIEAYVETIQRLGLDCRLEVSGEQPTLTPEVRLGIYRIVQEALHNVVRHAGADEAVVRMEVTDQMVRVAIRDNGSGFDPQQAVQPTSLGLLSMRERAESIGATFAIVSRPGGGTAIVIERPNSGDMMSDEVLESMMSMSGNHSMAEGQPLETDDSPRDATADLS